MRNNASKLEIPKPIEDAVIAMLLPYVPNITLEALEKSVGLKSDPEKPEQMLSRQDAADLLRVSIPTIDRMLRDGELPRRKIRGAVRIPLSVIESLMCGRE